MIKEIKHIWYASYGSNILESRFHCYIAGGKPNGSSKTYIGCSDKTLPEEKEDIIIKSELYFAKKSKSWNNGGVAFINPNFDDNKETLARMYLITTEQFIDVIKQEINNNGELNIDFERVIKNGSLTFKEKSWYGEILYLGNQNEHPIFTFTNEKYLTDFVNPPSIEYLKVIINGLKETYNMNDIEINEYFKNKLGIQGFEIENELKEK